ncbi:MAG: phosphotransbutyrylase [Firmicutes bacterium]|nr:phosphotransbutyrylase [Bacillota bacterium]
MKNVSRNTIMAWMLVFFWAILIFFLSAQPAETSNQSSLRVTELIVVTVAKVVAPDIDAEKLAGIVKHFNNLVRKLAHSGLYFVLGLLLVCAAAKMGVTSECKLYTLTFLFCLLYSVTDEFHQIFVPGRSGQISDVIIDASGAAVGIGICWLVQRIKKQ